MRATLDDANEPFGVAFRVPRCRPDGPLTPAAPAVRTAEDSPGMSPGRGEGPPARLGIGDRGLDFLVRVSRSGHRVAFQSSESFTWTHRRCRAGGDSACAADPSTPGCARGAP